MEMIDYECHVKLSSGGMEMQGIGPSRVSVFKFVLGELGNDFEDFGMDLIGKIKSGCTLGQAFYLSFWSKDKDFRSKEIQFKLIQKFEGIREGILEHLPNFFDPFIQFSFS